MGSFDSYELAANVAQFPLPVIAGIGHERDETIVDRVAYLSVKTPTAAAAFLIEAFQRQADRLAAARQLMADAVRRLVREARDVQSRHVVALRQGALSLVEERSNRLALLAKEMGHASRSFVNRQAGTLEQVYIEACENYQKQSYRNRCRYYAGNGAQRGPRSGDWGKMTLLSWTAGMLAREYVELCNELKRNLLWNRK